MNILNNRKTNKALGLITLLLWLTTLSEGWAAGGTVVSWGGSFVAPTNDTDVMGISVGVEYGMALKSNGTVFEWENSSFHTYGPITIPPELTNVVMIGMGSYHGLALKSDGTVAAWGFNYAGQTNVPEGLSNVVAISAGGGHNLALKNDGTVVVWGLDNYGQTDMPANLNHVVAVAGGIDHSLALKSDGTVVAWGAGTNDLGRWPYYGQSIVPVGLSNVVAIAAGRADSLALKSDGTVVQWGAGVDDGNLAPPGLSNVVAIAVGNYYCLALKSDGTVVAWGDNYAGQTNVPVGLSNVVAIAAGAQQSLALQNDGSPYIAKQPLNLMQYDGQTATFAPVVRSALPLSYQWQWNATNINGATNAALALSNVQTANNGNYSVIISNVVGTVVSSNALLTVISGAPIILDQPVGQNVLLRSNLTLTVNYTGSWPVTFQWQLNGINIAGATNASLTLNPQLGDMGNYTLVLSNAYGSVTSSTAALQPSSSVLVPWGDDHYGQTNVPPGLTNVVAIASGLAHNVVLISDGTVVAWGFYFTGYNGQINVQPVLTNVIAVAAGSYQALALKSDGTVAAWGGTAITPDVAAQLTNVVAIAGGLFHSLALRSDGTLVDWGRSDLGLSNTAAGMSGVASIACGAVHDLVLKNDGTVVAWGYNGDGETNVPSGLTNVVAIAAGSGHSLALKSDGTVVAWGDDSKGQTDVPPGLSNVVAISSQFWHCEALKSDGTVVGWGGNNLYNSWDSNIDPSRAPAPSGLSNVVAISTGYYHSMAFMNDGSPHVARQPLNRSANAGADAFFSLGAVGTGPLSYQWRLNGVNIDGATNSTLTLTHVQAANQGSYSVVVNNAYGTVTSSSATLTVKPLSFNTSPANTQMTAGGFHLQLDGLNGASPVVIYASPNMVDWQPIYTNPPVVGSLQFLDSTATNATKRFYRAVEQ
ncbi:MAG: hypothetical protein JWR26_3167 [Pedosphaera sp.]|nr:hypothetical protein [Pedosphaera sp.]